MAGQQRVISSTFNVSTVDETVSLQAQYSPDMNIVHSTWQEGDLYMRTKMTNETTWSAWHKIVGESGGETDYQFALSANLVTQDGTSATAPSDISSSAWQDAPMATTTQKPYLWSKVQKKDGNGNNVGSATYIRLTGEEGKDGLSPNPNILLRTVFDRGIDKVKEKWEADWSYVGIDDESDTIVDGRKCVRINASSLSTDKDFSQDVYGKLKTSTWYTLSFNYFATQAFYTFIWDGNNSHGIVDTSAGYYLDGVFYNSSLGIDGNHQWPANWTGARHSITFKTKSSFGTTHAYILFRCPSGAQVAICMPKLELGENATAYMANEDDLGGEKGENAFVVDLENEMSNVALDEDGKLTSALDMYFKVRAYYGTQNVLDDCTVTATCSNANIIVDTNAATTSGNGIRLTANSGISVNDTTDVTVTVVHATYGTRVVVFTLAGVRGGENAVLQELLPSLDAISFARQDDGSLTPANRSLSLSIKKTQGGVTTIQTLSGDMTIRWSASSMPTTSSGGNDWGRETETGIRWDNITMKIASGVEASNVYIAMFNSSGTLLDRETIPIIKDGKHGKDVFTVDLENEMTNVALTEDGNTLTAVDFYFKVQAFYGTTNVLSDNECTVSASCSDNNVTLDTTYAKTNGIRVQVAQNVALANSTDITVTVAHTTYGTRTVVFILAGVRGGKNAVLQELLPSLDNITFARLASGGLTPSSRDLTLSIKKTQGGVTTIQSLSTSGLTVKWSVSSMPSSSDSGYNWGYGGDTGITWSGNTMQIENTVEATNLYIAAFNSDGILVDRETIPVIRDGNNGNDGDDAPAAFANPDKISVQCIPPNGSVTASQATGVTFSLKVGTHNATVTSVSSGTKPTGVTVTGQADNAVTVTIDTTATASGLSAGVTFTVTGTYDGKTYSANVTVALIGSTQGEQGRPGGTGPRGKIGRAYYYATEWNPNDNTKSFLVDDTQAPFFSNAGSNLNKYYAYNAETNGYYTMSQMAGTGSIDWNSEPWSLMTDDFKYLITEALFTKFAKLGSAIFNQDFMYSKYLNNELSMYYGYSGQSIARSLSNDYALLISQTSLSVVEGKQYKISITCYHNSGYSDALYSRVYYNTKSDWSGSLSGSSAFISVSSNTSATYDIDFVAIQTGYVRIYNVGYGTITKIVASQSESYENVSPMFINTDDVPLLPAGGVGTSDVTTTGYYGAPTFLKSDNTPVESVVTVPIPVVSSRTYKVTFNAKVSGGTGYVALCREDNDSVISSYSTITNTELESQELNISNYSYTGNAYLRFCVSSSPYTITVNEVYIKCPDAFVPQAIVDWLTGYAHFSGDRVRFNPDGSGHLANQNILWNANGDLTVSGYVKKKKIIINSSNYNSYIKTIFSSYTVLDISKCGSWIEFSGYITSGALDVELPNLSADVPASSDEKDFVRSFGGTVLQIYNKSTTNIEVILSRSGGVSTSSILIGQACTYECVIDGGDGGKERVRWMEIFNPFTIL